MCCFHNRVVIYPPHRVAKVSKDNFFGEGKGGKFRKGGKFGEGETRETPGEIRPSGGNSAEEFFSSWRGYEGGKGGFALPERENPPFRRGENCPSRSEFFCSWRNTKGKNSPFQKGGNSPFRRGKIAPPERWLSGRANFPPSYHVKSKKNIPLRKGDSTPLPPHPPEGRAFPLLEGQIPPFVLRQEQKKKVKNSKPPQMKKKMLKGKGLEYARCMGGGGGGKTQPCCTILSV